MLEPGRFDELMSRLSLREWPKAPVEADTPIEAADHAPTGRGALFIAKFSVVRYRANFGRNLTLETNGK